MAGVESRASSQQLLQSPDIPAAPEIDRIQSNCGLFAAIYVGDNPGEYDLRSITLRAGADLQHRAEGGAGYAVFDSKGDGQFVRGLGKIDVAFQDGSLLPRVRDARIVVLHTRYPTAGRSDSIPDIQPLTYEGITLAHHGNLTNAETIRDGIDGLQMDGECPDSDSWYALNAIVRAAGNTLAEKMVAAQKGFEGGWAFIATDGKSVVASRDPQGIRPLFLATIGDPKQPQVHLLSVEPAPFNSLGVNDYRDVLPGETIAIDGGKAITIDLSPDPQQRSCIFEIIYMMHPDSQYMGQEVYVSRRNAGHLLWQEQPVETGDDEKLVVMPVPDSGRPSALGYFKEARKDLGDRVDYDEGLLINRYVGRNFIKPTGKRSPSEKFYDIEEIVAGRKIVLVDDSLVRGETMTGIIAMLRNAGAKEVHVRLASPKIVRPCHWGVAISTYEELAGYRYPDTDDLAIAIGADSLGYISLDGLYDAVGADAELRERFCSHCFGGNSPRMNGQRPGTIPLVEFVGLDAGYIEKVEK